MNVREFQALLDRVGSDPGDWPDEARAAAEALLATDAAARAALRAAKRLDLLLADASSEVDHAAEQRLIERTLQAIERQPPRPFGRLLAWLWPERRASRWARATLACLVPLAAGFALGISSSNESATELAELSQSAFVIVDTEPTLP